MTETRIPKRGTIEEREAWTAEQRERWRERDRRRIELADEFAERARLTIPDEKGFLIVEPGTIAEASAVEVAANKRIDEIGTDKLVAKYRARDVMARHFLPKRAHRLDSPYVRFALCDDVVTAVTAYLGMVPILFDFDVWYSPPSEEETPRNAQRWHLDGDDTRQVKVWVHCNDITPESGPLTIFNAEISSAFAKEIAYDSSIEYRIRDKKVSKHVAGEKMTAFAGPKGTVDFVDTSRCFHFGSRVTPGSPGRRVFYAQYVTPYAFKFAEEDHRQSAPLRDLAAESSSELEALVLGAV